jgi:hypothetical protein
VTDAPVVLVGSPLDPHISAIASDLADRGVDVLVADTLSFPAQLEISLAEQLDAITIDGRTVGRPAAAYLRDIYAHPLAVGMDVADEMAQDWRRTLIALREKGQLLLPLLARWCAAGVPMYNPTSGDWRHPKALQLALLKEAGLPVPRTLWTNDPEAVRRFADGRRVV